MLLGLKARLVQLDRKALPGRPVPEVQPVPQVRLGRRGHKDLRVNLARPAQPALKVQLVQPVPQVLRETLGAPGRLVRKGLKVNRVPRARLVRQEVTPQSPRLLLKRC